MSSPHQQNAPVDGGSGNVWNKVRPADRYHALCHEFTVLQHLQGCPIVPRLLSERVSNNGKFAWFSMQRAVGTPLSRHKGLNNKVCDTMYEAIKTIHQLGVVHCDLKGEHIFLAEDGSVMIIDFDLAQLVAELKPHSRLGHPFRGSLRYASTLTHLGYRPDFSFDFESLGFVLLEQAIGILPWSGLSLKTTDNDKRIQEVGVAKIRWLTSTNTASVEMYTYLTTGCPQGHFKELLSRLSSPNPPPKAEESKRESADNYFPNDDDDEKVVHVSESAPRVDNMSPIAKTKAKDLSGSIISEGALALKKKFCAGLSAALGCKVTEETTATSQIDVSCLANDLAKLEGNQNWFFKPLQVSEKDHAPVFNAEKSRVLIEIGVVVSDPKGTKTNAIRKMDQLHTRLDKLLGKKHPLTLVNQVAYAGIGIQVSITFSPEELCEKVLVHLSRHRFDWPAEWVMASLGRYVFLSLRDGETTPMQDSLSADFKLVSALSSQACYPCKRCGGIYPFSQVFQSHLAFCDALSGQQHTWIFRLGTSDVQTEIVYDPTCTPQELESAITRALGIESPVFKTPQGLHVMPRPSSMAPGIYHLYEPVKRMEKKT